MSTWKHAVFGGSTRMHLKLFSCNAFSISPGLLSLFQLPEEEAKKNGWCVRFGHCQRQAHSRINSVLPNDHQLPHGQGRGPSVFRITVMKFGYTGKHTAKAGVFLLACVAGWHRFLCWLTLTCPQDRLSRISWHAWCLACYWFWFFIENLATCFLHVMGKKIEKQRAGWNKPLWCIRCDRVLPGVLSSLNTFVSPNGFLYIRNVSLHWDACFPEVGLLFKFMSPPFTRVHLHTIQVFFKAMWLNFSKFRQSYPVVQNSFPVFISQTGTRYELYLCS